MLILGRRHLERVMREWIEHYNAARPHRSLGLKTSDCQVGSVRKTKAVQCRARLGGVLREYSVVQTAAAV